MKEKQHKINSMTKSFLSALVGIAIHKGYIEHEDIPIVSYFKDIDDSKSKITIRNLLMMSSGLHFPGNEAMIPSRNWVRFTLDQPMETEPGHLMKYSCGNSHLLSAILQAATKVDTVAFARKYLFEPMGIHDFNWHRDAQGIAIGGFSMTMKLEDLLKFGILYLNRGRWKSTQLISEEWVLKSTDARIKASNGASYGYHWWVLNDRDIHHSSSRTFYAAGLGGQYIFVHEDRRLVTVFTGNYIGDMSRPVDYYLQYIL